MTTPATDPESRSPNSQRPPVPPPPLVKFVLVQGIGFRCTAYRDPQGQWRDAYSGAELAGEIKVIEP